MKREAAWSGPTPAMIRWTVVRDCGLRDLAGDRPATAAARQLRGLVEWSRARAEGMAVDGWCLQPAMGTLPDSGAGALAVGPGGPAGWLGFRAEEVFAVFGGEAQAVAACSNCPVNATPFAGGLAGCWGQLAFHTPPVSAPVTRLRLLTGQMVTVADMAGWLEQALEKDRELARDKDACFPRTRPDWYGLWIGSEWSSRQMDWIDRLDRTAADRPASPDWERLVAGVRSARKTGMPFRFERTPPGEAVGGEWRWPAHCRTCGWVRAVRSSCPCCGDRRPALAERSGKVLGLQPWLRMERVLEQDRLGKLVERLRSREPQGE